MKTNETYYAITGYIPSDENIPFVTIYKLCKIGQSDPKYVWISVTHNGGIGTGTDIHKDNLLDAAFEMYGFLDSEHRVGKFSFEEAVEIYQSMKEKLEKEAENKN